MIFRTPNQQEAAADAKGRETAAEDFVIRRKATLLAAAAAVISACAAAGAAYAQSPGNNTALQDQIPAVPVAVMNNAREQAGPHPDAKPAASAMGMRPERRAAAAAGQTMSPTAAKPKADQVDLKDAVDQAVRDARSASASKNASAAPEARTTTISNAETAGSAKEADNDSQEKAAERVPAKSVIIRSPRVNVLPGINVVIPIARNQPNRLLTPFKHPQVLSTDLQGGQGDNCGEACVRGSVLYVSTDQAKPVTAFITERGREDIAISVTMIPERIAPRQVEFVLPKSVMEKLNITDVGAVEGSSTQARVWEQSQPYIDTLKESFKAIALGQVPQGFSLRNAKSSDKLPVCRQHGLSFNFRKGQVLEGHNLMVYVGVVKNTSAAPVEFNETRCGSWNVAAVTSFPLKVLDKGEQTEVYVAVKREKKPAAGTVRRPLIDRKF